MLDVVTVSFESLNLRGWYIRHSSFFGMLTQFRSGPDTSVLDRSPLEKMDATFIIRPGLSGTPEAVSFESVNYLGSFLRHQNYRLKLQPEDGTDLFHADASFLWQPALITDQNAKDRNARSLESVNFRNHFVRHQNYELWLAPSDAGNPATFSDDASFIPWPGLRPPGVETVSFQSVNKPDKYIRHRFFLGVLTEATNVLDKADATFIVRQPALSGVPEAVSLESVNYPGYYLRHQNYRLKLHRDDGTNLFHQDASFLRRRALSTGHPDAVSLESVNFRNHFVRHQNYELWLAPSDAGNPATFSDDASFIPLDRFVAEPLPCGVHRVGAAPAIPTGPVAVPTFINTERIGQLTGSTDPEGLPILNNTGVGEWRNAGVEGVDLGACVKHKDRLYFFFGDVAGKGAAFGSKREGADLVAWTADTALRPGGFSLHPVKAGPDGWFDPFSLSVGSSAVVIPGLNLAPSGGFSYTVAGNDTIFVFALWHDPGNPTSYFPTTVLASKEDPAQPGSYHKEFTFSYRRFWSVVPTKVKNALHPRLPSQEGEGLILLAGGDRDAVHLAWMKLDPARGPLLSTVRYYTGNPEDPWSPSSGLDEDTARTDPARALEHEEEAKTVVGLPPYFSSVSAAWLEDAKRWVLLYSTAVFEPHNPDLQRPTLPIVARFGANPWSWSNEVEVFNPCRDLAFGHFIHWPGLDDIDSRVPPRLNPDKDAWAIERGHPYGASVLTQFTRYEPTTQELTLVYLMSAFNPYQVQVMRTRLWLPAE
jgi:Alpha-L-arabinofuranosidase B (ABFB) domain